MTGFVDLTDGNFKLREDAYPRLLATMYYPNCPASINQVTNVIMHERQRYNAEPSGDFVSSEVAQALLLAAERQRAQIFFAGYMGMALAFRAQFSDELQDSDAHRVAAELVKQFGAKANYVSKKSGEPKLLEMSLPNGETSFKRALTTYQSVLPICAASVAMAQNAVPNSPHKVSLNFEQRFINTVVDFQAWMGDVYEIRQWPRWIIDPNGHGEVSADSEYETQTFLTRKVLHNILMAYDAVFPDLREKYVKSVDGSGGTGPTD